MAAPPHPLDIPELRIRIASFLSSADHKTCMLLNKAWYKDLLPTLWSRSVFYPGKFMECQPEERSMRLEELRACAPLIKDLFLHFHRIFVPSDFRACVCETLRQGCRSLETISLPINTGPKEIEIHHCIMQMLALNSATLQRITLHFNQYGGQDEFFFQELALHQALSPFLRLRHLEVDSYVFIKDAILILESCPQLETFTLARHGRTLYSKERSGPKPSNMTQQEGLEFRQWLKTLPSFNLKHLAIGAACNDADLGVLLGRCRLLESLRLSAMYKNAIPQVRETLRDGHCLRHLTSFAFSMGIMARDESHFILQSIPLQQLREVHLYFAWMTDIDLLVDRQSQTLQALTCYTWSTSAKLSVMKVLHDCRQLRKFKFVSHPLDGFVDIRHGIGQVWNSPLLEELDISFELDSRCNERNLLQLAASEKMESAPGRYENEQAEIVFMKRLGSLGNLRHLKLYESFDHDIKRKYMQWSMDTGLQHLASLSRLETLDFAYYALPLGIPELHFLKEHWVSLKVIRCGLIRVPEVRYWLDREWPELSVVTLQEYTY
ncbi:hypothetical protein BGZ73_001861 [Actinomortierella ambigua]|nr:hypothetical protein BGZ73_001861 [Actinomortierella ambigua]